MAVMGEAIEQRSNELFVVDDLDTHLAKG